MSAEITKTTVARRFRAWCQDCQDGYQGSKPTVTKWASRHNAERHALLTGNRDHTNQEESK